MSDGFNVKMAAYLAGFRSGVMLDYLERQGVFEREQMREPGYRETAGKGRVRRYTFRDVVILRAVSRLLERGVSVSRIKVAMMELARNPQFECERGRLRYEQQPIQFVVTDGTDLFFPGDDQALVSLLQNGQQAFSFVMDFEVARKEVDAGAGPKRRSA